MDGQVSWPGTVIHSHFKLLQYMGSFSYQNEDVVIHNGWTPEEEIIPVFIHKHTKTSLKTS